jgi:predicted transcriptional regulator
MSELEMGSDVPQKARSSFSMEKELYKKLKATAEAENKSVSAVLEEAVRQFFNK